MGSLSQLDGLEEPFDYVVVGGGTAGLVVASRLTEDSSIRVLVIEAGADHTSHPLILTPGLVAGVYGKDEFDWNFTSVPQVRTISVGGLIQATLLTIPSSARSPRSTTDASTRPAARCWAVARRSTL